MTRLTYPQAFQLAIEAARMQGMMQSSREAAEFAQFVSERQIANLCELGTCSGGTMYLLDKACKPGLRISMDRIWPERDPKDAKDHEADFHLHLPHIIEVLGDIHHAEQQARLGEVLNGRELDLLFIDADHSYEGGKKHWEMYSPFVRRGGFVAWHDVRNGWACGQFYDELCAGYPHYEFTDQEALYGIGIIQLYG
jgi:predicted O-methyltransferase YrrM